MQNHMDLLGLESVPLIESKDKLSTLKPKFIMTQNTTLCQPKTYRIAKTQMTVHSVLHIVIAVLCTIFTSVLLVIGDNELIHIGLGIWFSVVFMVLGAFGLGASKHKTYCLITTYMILCIGNIAVAVMLLVQSVTAAVYHSPNFHGFGMINTKNPVDSTYFALTIFIAILSFIELIISIWSPVLCWRAVRYCRAYARITKKPGTVPYAIGMNEKMVYGNDNSPARLRYN